MGKMACSLFLFFVKLRSRSQDRSQEVDLEGDSKGEFRGDFKQDMEGDLLSNSDQVRSRSGLAHVSFSLQLKLNSLELDSEVGRFVLFETLPY